MDNQYLFLEARRHNQAMVDADGNISDDDMSSHHQSPARPAIAARPAVPARPASPHIDAEEEELSANYDFSNDLQLSGQEEDNEELGAQNGISDPEEEDPNNYLEENADDEEVVGNKFDTNGVCRFLLLKNLFLYIASLSSKHHLPRRPTGRIEQPPALLRLPLPPISPPVAKFHKDNFRLILENSRNELKNYLERRPHSVNHFLPVMQMSATKAPSKLSPSSRRPTSLVSNHPTLIY